MVNADSFLTSPSQHNYSEAASYASLDVVSLYTNVDNRSVVDAVISFVHRNRDQTATMGFSENEVRMML